MIKQSIKNLLVAVLIAPLFSFAAIAAEKPVAEKDNPTYSVTKDGTVDWSTFNGFRVYSASCIHCHGPDGMGSTIGPSLTEALKDMSYKDFFKITSEGKKTDSATRQAVMPAFGKDPNIKCYIDDIYVYLKARSDDAIPRGRPEKKAPKTDAWKTEKETCLSAK